MKNAEQNRLKTVKISADLYALLSTDAKKQLRTAPMQLETILEEYFLVPPLGPAPKVETPRKINKETRELIEFFQELVKKLLRKSKKNQEDMLDYLEAEMGLNHVRSIRTRALLAVVMDILHEDIHDRPRRDEAVRFQIARPVKISTEEEDILNAEILEIFEKLQQLPTDENAELSVTCKKCGTTDTGTHRFLKGQGWDLKRGPLCIQCDLF